MKLLVLLKFKQRGLTLLELLIVLLVMGIIASLSAPNWFNFLNLQKLNQSTEQIQLVLRQVQNRSKQENGAYQVEFRVNTQNNNFLEYTYYRFDATTPPAPNTKQWQAIVNQPDSLTVSLAQGSSIIFNRDGTISSNSDLRVDEKIVLSLSNVSVPKKRCIFVQTLLGVLSTGKDKECD